MRHHYTNSIAVKYGVDAHELAALDKIKGHAHQLKEGLFVALGGTHAAGIGLRIPLKPPDVYDMAGISNLMFTLRSCFDVSNPFTHLLEMGSTMLRGPDGRLLIDLVNNRMHDGAKVSKHMLKLIQKSEEAQAFWARSSFLAVKNKLPRLPGNTGVEVTPEALVQNLFQYLSTLRATGYISFEFDDFANASETNSFKSCYRVGIEGYERSPYTLALSPDVGILVVKSSEDALLARSFFVIDKAAKQVAFFGAYGELATYKEAAMQHIFDKLWKQQPTTVLTGNVGNDESGKRSVKYSNANGVVIGEDCVRAAPVGDRFETCYTNPDPVVLVGAVGAVYGKIPFAAGHMPCPVCGEYGPQTEHQIICRECANPHLAETLISGAYRRDDSWFGVAA